MEIDYSIDSQNYREVLQNFSQQVTEGFKLGTEVRFVKPFNKVFIIGMGGSALAGEILKNYFYNTKIPVFTIKDYRLPDFMDENSLVIIISYSGNTDETIEAYRKIARKNYQTVIITSGGKLETITPMYNHPLIKLPGAIQPRAAIGYMFFAVLGVLYQAKVVPEALIHLKNTQLTVQKKEYETYAIELAKKIGQKIPVIYSSSSLSSIGYIWKISFNENPKRMAISNTLPEATHNELEPLVYADEHYTIIIKDTDDDPRNKRKMDALKEFLKKNNQDAMEITIRGEDKLSKIFSAIYLGEWVSYYVALQNGIDPTPIDTIEEFKKQSKLMP